MIREEQGNVQGVVFREIFELLRVMDEEEELYGCRLETEQECRDKIRKLIHIGIEVNVTGDKESGKTDTLCVFSEEAIKENWKVGANFSIGDDDILYLTKASEIDDFYRTSWKKWKRLPCLLFDEAGDYLRHTETQTPKNKWFASKVRRLRKIYGGLLIISSMQPEILDINLSVRECDIEFHKFGNIFDYIDHPELEMILKKTCGIYDKRGHLRWWTNNLPKAEKIYETGGMANFEFDISNTSFDDKPAKIKKIVQDSFDVTPEEIIVEEKVTETQQFIREVLNGK